MFQITASAGMSSMHDRAAAHALYVL